MIGRIKVVAGQEVGYERFLLEVKFLYFFWRTGHTVFFLVNKLVVVDLIACDFCVDDLEKVAAILGDDLEEIFVGFCLFQVLNDNRMGPLSVPLQKFFYLLNFITVIFLVKEIVPIVNEVINLDWTIFWPINKVTGNDKAISLINDLKFVKSVDSVRFFYFVDVKNIIWAL